MPALLLANPYVDLILALALAWLSLKIVQALFGPLGFIPGVTKAERAIAQSVTNACGSIASGASAAVGGSLHTIARLIDRSAAAIKRPAVALLEAATIIGAIAAAVHALRDLVHKAVGSFGAILPRVKTLEKEYHGIEHRVKTLEREIGAGIGHDLRIHIKALEKWEKAAKEQLAADEQAITQTIPAELGKLEDWIGMEVGQTKTQWEMAIGTAILAALGLGGLNCNSNPFKNNKNACGLWGDLGDILGLLAATLAVLNFEDLVKEMQALEEVTVTGLHDVLNMV